jgi:hypothetical protein
MRIVRFDKSGNCQFVYFDWREFKLKTTCWARNLDGLFGGNKDGKHVFIGLHNR